MVDRGFVKKDMIQGEGERMRLKNEGNDWVSLCFSRFALTFLTPSSSSQKVSVLLCSLKRIADPLLHADALVSSFRLHLLAGSTSFLPSPFRHSLI